MDSRHLARWIDKRMVLAGVAAEGVGHRAVQLAGPRTRDVVQVARRCFDHTWARSAATPEDTEAAFDDIVADQEPLLLSIWNDRTAQQQNVLRAVAAGIAGLTTSESLNRFSLPSSGSAANTAKDLIETGLLTKAETTTGYDYDSPFFRRWIRLTTLDEVGLLPPY